MPDIETNVEIVIKIPKKVYDQFGHEFSEENLISKGVNEAILDAFIKGTVLPEGHGRIADMDEAIKCIKECKGEDATWAIALIEWACSKRTLIEADKER